MLDIKQVRQDPQQIAQALKKKRFEFPVAEFLRLDSERKEADIRSQELLAERKKASKAVGALIAQGDRVGTIGRLPRLVRQDPSHPEASAPPVHHSVR